jgi:ABC-type antimicrobial peptide transport system permease subunit
MGLNGNISSIPPWLSGIAIVFAIFVGTLSGYFPSVRAMKLSPLQAIRNE